MDWKLVMMGRADSALARSLQGCAWTKQGQPLMLCIAFGPDRLKEFGFPTLYLPQKPPILSLSKDCPSLTHRP